ncbi:MAG: 30S ribosomal protein S11 [archaeon]|nr:30S ribosomal protein S11 [archaeon]
MVDDTNKAPQELEMEQEQKSKEGIVEEQSEKTEEKKEKVKKDRIGILSIQTTKNNTILSLTDMVGNTLARASGGQSTKQARLKSSPTVAMFASKKIAEEAIEHGINSFYVRIKAQTGEMTPSSVSHAVIKSLTRDDFKIISILDITRSPRGGPKKKGGRRGRRV